METYVEKYRKNFGIDIRWISTQNEPTNNTPLSSCTYSAKALGRL